MNLISVVIPVYDEFNSLRKLYDKIQNLSLTNASIKEIIFIDDGSRDGSAGLLEAIKSIDLRVRVLRFEKNRGQHKALEAGFLASTGDIIVSMDADLQNDPSDIPLLLKKIEEGNDLVCGWRKNRMDNALKIIKSNIANLLQRFFTRVALHDMSCTFRAYRAHIAQGICMKRRYEVGLIPYLLSKKTNHIAEVQVMHYRRFSGKSKYGFISTCIGTIAAYIEVLILNAFGHNSSSEAM